VVLVKRCKCLRSTDLAKLVACILWDLEAGIGVQTGKSPDLLRHIALMVAKS
jgi:hypothetical protein